MNLEKNVYMGYCYPLCLIPFVFFQIKYIFIKLNPNYGVWLSVDSDGKLYFHKMRRATRFTPFLITKWFSKSQKVNIFKNPKCNIDIFNLRG